MKKRVRQADTEAKQANEPDPTMEVEPLSLPENEPVKAGGQLSAGKIFIFFPLSALSSCDGNYHVFYSCFADIYPKVTTWTHSPLAVQWFIYELGLRIPDFARRKQHGPIFTDISDALKRWNYHFSREELVSKRRTLDAAWCKSKGKGSCQLSWFDSYSIYKQGMCPPMPEAPEPLGSVQQNQAIKSPQIGSNSRQHTPPPQQAGTSATATSKHPQLAYPSVATESTEDIQSQPVVPDREIPYRLRGEGNDNSTFQYMQYYKEVQLLQTYCIVIEMSPL